MARRPLCELGLAEELVRPCTRWTWPGRRLGSVPSARAAGLRAGMPSTCWAPGLRLIPARQTPLLHEAAAGPRLRPPLMPWDATRGLCCCVCCVPKEGCRADGCTNGLPVAKAPRHATLWMELDGRPWWGSWTGFTVWRGAGSEKGRRGPRAGKPGESVTVLPRYVLRSLTASRAGCRASRPLGGLYKAPACTDGSGCFGGGAHAPACGPQKEH